MWLYYDEYDRKHYNWIARPVPDEKNKSFTLNYEKSYYKKRMTHMNNEISQKVIYETIEKAVPLAIKGFEEFTKTHNKFVDGVIDKSAYLHYIKIIKKELSRNSYSTIDIYHGDLDIQSYYEKGTRFVEEVFFLINDMIISIERGDEDSFIRYFFEIYTKRYQKCYKEYLQAKELIDKNL